MASQHGCLIGLGLPALEGSDLFGRRPPAAGAQFLLATTDAVVQHRQNRNGSYLTVRARIPRVALSAVSEMTGNSPDFRHSSLIGDQS